MSLSLYLSLSLPPSALTHLTHLASPHPTSPHSLMGRIRARRTNKTNSKGQTRLEDTLTRPDELLWGSTSCKFALYLPFVLCM